MSEKLHTHQSYLSDRDAVVIANMGGSASSRHLMEGWIDSITLKEHNINTFTNYFSGTCPDPDSYWNGHLQCVKYNARDTVKYWRTQLDNLIRYGPLARVHKSP